MTLSIFFAAFDPWELFMEATLVVKGVIVVLVLFFHVCVYIIIYKAIVLNRARSQSRRFLDLFWGSRSYDEVYQQSVRFGASPVAHIFAAGYTELAKIQSKQESPGTASVASEIRDRDLGQIENIERALNSAYTEQLTKLEGMIPFLATTGSTAPFIGLFGTVWGIMHSFMRISDLKSVSLTTVAPGIAEALIATAIGLVAAVPAVIAYNYFLRKIRIVSAGMSTFSDDFMNITKRYFLK
jgi:biopolymer transport protein TolQ